ncbi:hypothetical protein NMY22_g19685 [Coprinellus aureogranulatus]|nr:hypothetical protein NMY22_g19685 [Coprinellus aureogranulatus]
MLRMLIDFGISSEYGVIDWTSATPVARPVVPHPEGFPLKKSAFDCWKYSMKRAISTRYRLFKGAGKLGPKMKGIVSQTVKEVLQGLVDDGLVQMDKIGSSNFFWSFPSQQGSASDLSKVGLTLTATTSVDSRGIAVVLNNPTSTNPISRSVVAIRSQTPQRRSIPSEDWSRRPLRCTLALRTRGYAAIARGDQSLYLSCTPAY